jgi:CO/xanthine dehydrogenase FAD-binding subunit
MKPAAFDYARPQSLDEACALLAADPDARLIAGGQTLVPFMAMRLARPSKLVDIARLHELSFIREEGDAVVIGAATRQCVAERDPLVAARLPLFAKAIPWVGHAATRARGTVGGSLANADPAAEIALVAVTLGATLRYRAGGRDGAIAAHDFFLGPMTTALPPAACLTAAAFPVWREARLGTAFAEVSARQSDFAFASAAAQVALDAAGRCRRLALGVGAVGPVPLRLDAVAETLVGTAIEEAAARQAIAQALRAVEPFDDLHASADYRRRAASVLALRALMEATAVARGQHAG